VIAPEITIIAITIIIACSPKACPKLLRPAVIARCSGKIADGNIMSISRLQHGDPLLYAPDMEPAMIVVVTTIKILGKCARRQRRAYSDNSTDSKHLGQYRLHLSFLLASFLQEGLYVPR